MWSCGDDHLQVQQHKFSWARNFPAGRTHQIRHCDLSTVLQRASAASGLTVLKHQDDDAVCCTMMSNRDWTLLRAHSSRYAVCRDSCRKAGPEAPAGSSDDLKRVCMLGLGALGCIPEAG